MSLAGLVYSYGMSATGVKGTPLRISKDEFPASIEQDSGRVLRGPFPNSARKADM
jgi:hypothetical protein